MPKKAVKKLKIKKSGIKTAKKSVELEYNKCMRCEKEFPSRASLKQHLKMHSQAIQEIKMLEEGYIPIESKIGFEFKGKNRIIVS